ncbi:metallophosphoesterase [Agriterribacter sp.]|uniref:metallophosphoesterase n=1 Tax=Agriterribacter sp. TaxID=2821509 RepID=UPI002BC949FB|nr:metallophosphoesterase [Agriterribacter sp.]HRO45137.1 metallophosphoesterase [Agriterribacter sp.]HRQ19515.1 metallophosphoesterase [Agriterribacter sp.]
MRSYSGTWIFILIVLLIDLYVFQAVKFTLQSVSPRTRFTVYSLYWGLSAVTVITLAILPYINLDSWPRNLRTYWMATIIGLFLSKSLTVIFLLADDLRRLLQWGGGKLFYQYIEGEPFKAAGISRSVFMSWLGLAVGGGLMTAMMLGFANKYRYQLKKVKLNFPNLPDAFKGLKVVHISDVHSGSFTDKKAVEHGVQMIMDQQADLILFTGDLVNDQASEMKDYTAVFARLRAPMGVFSTLGNHDYGDYRKWLNQEEKVQNLERLKQLQTEMGWRLLMNEHVVLEKQGQQIALLGIENWGAKANFPKYGKLHEAYAGTEKYPFKILMSHDPSHWDAQVRPEYSDIDLTLSGHTHGMQFGVEVPGFKWSPVQYVYKQWAGLYEQAHQKLYINRGFGFIGYPGRVGILPEITLIELS